MRDIAQVVFLIGAGHSGSTMMDMVLGAHPTMFSLGEITHWGRWVAEDRLCTCRRPIRDCVVWSQVITRLGDRLGIDLTQQQERLSLDIPLPRTGLRAKARLALKLGATAAFGKAISHRLEVVSAKEARKLQEIADFYHIIREVTGRSVLIDSSKDVLRATYLCLKWRPESYRVIHLVRDGRGYMHSAMKTTYTIEQPVLVNDKTVMARESYPRPVVSRPRQAAREWLVANLLSMLALALLPKGTWLRVRYEDLCRTPEAVLERICRQIGVAYNKQMLAFRAVAHHNIGGNPSRFRSEGILQPSERWRETLTAGHLRMFARTAGWLNRYYGYR